jgi:hypothetical protein
MIRTHRVTIIGGTTGKRRVDLRFRRFGSFPRRQAMDYRKELIELGLWSEDDLRDPSQDIAAAWDLQEKLEAVGWSMRLGRVEDGWSCYLHHPESWAEIISCVHPTAALAIARAALQKEKLMTSAELSLIKERNEQHRRRKARDQRGISNLKGESLYE